MKRPCFFNVLQLSTRVEDLGFLFGFESGFQMRSDPEPVYNLWSDPETVYKLWSDPETVYKLWSDPDPVSKRGLIRIRFSKLVRIRSEHQNLKSL